MGGSIRETTWHRTKSRIHEIIVQQVGQDWNQSTCARSEYTASPSHKNHGTIRNWRGSALLPLSRFKEATTYGRAKLGESTRPVLRWILCLMVLNHRLRAPLNLNLLSTLAWNEHTAVGWRSYGRKNNSPSLSRIESRFLLFPSPLGSGLSDRNRRFPSLKKERREEGVRIVQFPSNATKKLVNICTLRNVSSANSHGRIVIWRELILKIERSDPIANFPRVRRRSPSFTMVNCISKHAGVERMHRPLIHRTRSIVGRRSVRSRPRHRAEWNRAERSGW